ncbi:MAG: nitroreductase family protein [Bacteroidales bacterium]|nr:nitroreductase family protein [Bacteroidales bacterium]MDD4669779.1 nitroreductase family protein [Bacteroidales bacterium]
MELLDLIKKSRSYRRFYQDRSVSDSHLIKMIEAARFSPSSRNIQPLKYAIYNTPEKCAQIFETLGWAGYLTEWKGPVDGERPAAYIVQLHDTTIAPGYSCDDGITAQSILLQAVELGYGGCIVATVKRDALARIIGIPECITIVNVIAIGVPKEKVVIDDMTDNQYRYWREEDGTHHVPKRTLKELIY